MLRVFQVLLVAAMLASPVFAQNSQPAQQHHDSVYAYDEFSKAISQSVNKKFSIDTIFLIIFVSILLVLLVVFYEIYNSNKSRQKLLDLAWERFNEHAQRLSLSKGSITLLGKIAHRANLQDPYSIIKSPHVFENALETYYMIKGISSLSSETLSDIRELRRALGFLPLSGEVSFISTRQFSNGERCLAQVPDVEPTTHKGSCIILSVGEREWSITRPEGSLSIEPGTLSRINLTRPGDAEYSFVTKVIKDADDALVLSHSNKLNRTQQRNWVRVDVSIPVEVKKLEKGHVSNIYSDKIIDMSAGGFGITLPVRLRDGTMLSLSFELPGHGPIENLLVKVVRVAGSYKNNASRIIHSVALEGVDVSKTQEQINQYVFEMQRQSIIAKNK
jgi:c-di-GMP-binding flagellar brake protein YcgR